MTTSIFDSKYKDNDKVERNTGFNSNFVYTALFGKEWKFGKGQRNAWTFDTKLTSSGDKTYTPIDLEDSRNNRGKEILYENLAFPERYATYCHWDVKFGVRINSAKRNMSHQFYIDLQNDTNRKNEFEQRYNEVTNEINTVYQIGFFLDVMYRIQF